MTSPTSYSVLLVEDEVMIRMMVADMLEELGHTVAGEPGEISQGIQLVQSIEFDLAIVDVNLNGQMITPVADVIKANRRPFIFATGYGAAGVPDGYRDQPTLQKAFHDRKARRNDRRSAEGPCPLGASWTNCCYFPVSPDIIGLRLHG
ncbi:response regulator [Bradyrhizobium sp. JYMT SZCCT0180]|uniref:response regulator n=1 Tax=Bradyrhizobium sp. JYMT SZCCT0180 TaxID=2807666 RepID=UPI002012C239|nr:response regulator [Bradyrhizobium sp. JYMT SZCCT0180]